MGLLDRINLTRHASEPPEAIDVTAAHEVEFTWPGGVKVAVPSRLLREGCPCAGCVEEFTGKKLLDPATIPADIRPDRIEPVGNYAIRFVWSDGHDTGLYTWKTLRAACKVE
jgi:DUF971 family protein